MSGIIGSLPYTLLNGQTADATQVMADFNTIVSSVNASGAANGSNSDITALTGLTTPLAISEGGTGASTLGAAHIVINTAGTSVIGNVPKFVNATGRNITDGYGVGTAADDLLQLDGSGDLPAISGANLTALPQGTAIQSNATEIGTTVAVAAVIPVDDTIPQITEGVEVMTLSVTPKSATSNIVIDVNVFGGNAAGAATVVMALFVDTTADSLGAVAAEISTGATTVGLNMKSTVASGSTATRTYRVRVGISAGTFTLNGANGARLFFGVARSSIVATEVAA